MFNKIRQNDKLIIIEFIQKFGIYGIALILLLVGILVSGSFFTTSNILNVLDAISYLGIMAAGMALVTYSGQLVDLSTSATIAVSSFVSILTLRYGALLMIFFVLSTGFIIGLVNGFIIGKLRINTVVWTLSMNFVLSGLVRMIFGSSTIHPSQGNVDFFKQISRYRIGGVFPISIVLMFFIFIVLHVLLEQSRIGAMMKMTGSSEIVAKYSGINVDKVICVGFIGSGVTASVTGLFISSLSKSACYNFGGGYDFQAITAIVLSGMVLDGGKGSMIGVLGGVFTIGLLNNIMTLLGVNTFLQNTLTGIVFILVVWFSSLSERKIGDKI